MGGGRAFRSWAGAGVVGWNLRLSEATTACVLRSSADASPFSGILFIFCLNLNEYNWMLSHIMNWREEQVQGRAEMQTSWPEFCLLFLHSFLPSAEGSLPLKGLCTLSYTPVLLFINFCFSKRFDISHLYFMVNLSRHVTSLRSNFPLASNMRGHWTRLLPALTSPPCSLQHENPYVQASVVDFSVIQRGRSFGPRRSFNLLIFLWSKKMLSVPGKGTMFVGKSGKTLYWKPNLRAKRGEGGEGERTVKASLPPPAIGITREQGPARLEPAGVNRLVWTGWCEHVPGTVAFPAPPPFHCFANLCLMKGLQKHLTTFLIYYIFTQNLLAWNTHTQKNNTQIHTRSILGLFYDFLSLFDFFPFYSLPSPFSC